MRRNRIAILCALAMTPVVFAAGNVTNERVLREAPAGANWFLKGGNFRGEHFSPLTAINEQTIGDLGLAWATNLPAPDGISATPIVVDGVIYLSGAFSFVFAIDAKSGDFLWEYDPEVRKRFSDDAFMSWSARVNRGVAVWDGSVYVATADCRLIALDAATGKEQWTKQTCDVSLGYAITDSPYVGGGKVFIGNAGSESREKNRGYVSAYDAASGELVWRFYTVPSDKAEENTTPAMKMAAATWSGDALEKYGGGGSAWNEMTYDPVSNLLFFGTAGGLPYLHHERSPEGGDNLFLSSVIAINADTGEYVWHYQTVPKDSWEYNATMNIILADLEIDGQQRETVLIAPKNGFQYVLDRHTGELLSADKFAKVNWATHINLETGRPVYDPAGEYWNLLDEGVAMVWPNFWGSHSWQPMAWHPDLELLYIPVVDVPQVMRKPLDGRLAGALEMLTEVDGKPFAPGKLVAYDPVRQQPRWTVERALAFNGGILSTAGNLVFQGNGEGRFEAFAADSGERLWSVVTGSAITAAPVSYLIDDEQYVLIPIGAGGAISNGYTRMGVTDESSGPTRLLAFSLASDAEIPIQAFQSPALPEQPELDASSESIALGKDKYASACQFCHGRNGMAKVGGSVPDLRYSNMETHETWHAIVVGGARKANGMPTMEVSVEDSEDIRNYILSLSEGLRESRR